MVLLLFGVGVQGRVSLILVLGLAAPAAIEKVMVEVQQVYSKNKSL